LIETGHLITLFFALCGVGIILAAILPDRRSLQTLVWTAPLASVAILWASGEVLFFGSTFQTQLWTLTPLRTLTLEMNQLSALFIFISSLVFLPVSIFSAQYMSSKYLGRESLKSFSAFYHALFASIVLVLVAADVFSFLIAWETMSILSYLLVNYEHEHKFSGYLMLAMGEAGTIAVAVALLILAKSSATLDFVSLRISGTWLSENARWAIFLLSFFGFGVKAGLVPVNIWLPRAHPVAPGNVSALLSGVILNLGIYGIIRVNMDLLPVTHIGPGLVTLIVGTASALVGILYATIEDDMKGMLAHSSIENIGIITAGLGAGFIFTISKHPILANIAFIAALYHMVNHSFYKSLLFLGVGAVDTNIGVRDMNRLGGLIKKMPWTGFFFLVGSLSISAMPPFNGFVSEWLTLQTLLRSAELQSTAIKIVFALSGAGLALTAALAVTCFVKAFAMSFLGMPRSKEVEQAVEVSRSMTVPMGILAVLCLVLGVLPTYVIPVLDQTLVPLTHASAVDALVPPFFTTNLEIPELPPEFVSEFHDLGAQIGRGVLPGQGLVVLHRGSTRNPVIFAMSTSYALVVLPILLGLSYVVIRWLTRTRTVIRRPRWDGGVRQLLPEMTYTATGFSNPVRVIFDAVFRPSATDTKETVAAHFRTAIHRTYKEVHVVDRLIFGPFTAAMKKVAWSLAIMHHGRINAYVTYVLLTLLVCLIITRFL
jgi:hydrogenase-4 component B